MSAHEGTTLKQRIPAQEREMPGLQKHMEPEPFDTRLEAGSGPKPYTGVGKLGGKKSSHHQRRISSSSRRRANEPIAVHSSGIGRAVVIFFAREGADVTIVHLPNEQKDAEDTARAIQNEGWRALSIAFDLEDFHNANKVGAAHVQQFGRIDILELEGDFAQIDLHEVESTFRSNILQMFAVTKFALPHMAKGSSIINTTSVTTFRGSSSMVDYVSTRSAIVGFARALARQLEPKGIRVNAVAPELVHTPLQPASRPAEQTEGFGEKTSIGRVGQPSEIAPSYVFLASAEAELYYGQILHPYPLGD
ncbi:general stress protein 39 [Wolfiporia cocos MD-104 SS10]|uniref:General stress protein 39 n=1 Tax=Wolfiporia cocos (strain MD-104) TaxID=742152 RepID=A0A2H3IYJ6_WOLCO|nr:general stress protein 39 [Wolfiporia cocos MD-104 SS10]